MIFSLKSIPLTMLALALCASLPACGSDDDEDCNGLDERGVCDGNVAKFCLVNTLVSEDCAKSNMFCDMDPVDGAYCTNRVEEKGDCGDITEKGICDGKILKHCDIDEDNGTKTLVSTNCAASNKVCDPYGFLGSPRCTEPRDHFDWEGKPCANYGIENNSNACKDNAIVVCQDNTLWVGQICEAPTTCQSTDSVYVNYECM